MTEFLNTAAGFLPALWEMSATAAYAAAVVIAVRLILKRRAPKQVICLLWLVVFARLLIPVSLKSPLSIVPDRTPVQTTQSAPGEQVDPLPPAGPALVDQTGPAVPSDSGQGEPVLAVPGNVTPAAPVSTRPQAEPAGPFPWRTALAGVWLAGSVVMGGFGLAAYLRLRRRLFDAIRAGDGAWEHPAVSSPFILGMLRPRIYLPAGLTGRPRQFILCHERAHLRRLDHIVKPMCWAALAFHWFNPLVWTAFLLMSRDIESACDEAVIRQLGDEVKADYSDTLLALASGRRIPTPCPLAFDEGDARGRIQNVLRYRRPTLWIVVVSALAVVLAAVCLLTDPVAADKPDDGPDDSQSSAADLDSPLAPWMQELLAGTREFHMTVSGESRVWDLTRLDTSVFEQVDLPLVRVRAKEAAVIDLDSDGIAELVVKPTAIDGWDHNGDVDGYAGYLIFRRQGDAVYSYAPDTDMIGLTADGTFTWDISMDLSGIGSARFDGNVFSVKRITWQDYTDQDNPRYFVDGLAADHDAYWSAHAVQNNKPTPVWYKVVDGAAVYDRTPPRPVISKPILLDEAAQSCTAPGFLTEEQQQLYREAYAFYSHVFGANTEEVEYWPGDNGPAGMSTADAVRIDGEYYNPARGRYANWDDFEEAALSVFTEDFWNAKNYRAGPGSILDSGTILYSALTPTYRNVDGQMYFIWGSKGAHGPNPNFPVTFTTYDYTDDHIFFTITACYSEPLLDGESFEERDERLVRGYDYSIEFPIEMVKTEAGWRFNQFHLPSTDSADLPFINQKIINSPNSPQEKDGWLLALTSWKNRLRDHAEEIALRQVGEQLYLDWGGVRYPIEENPSRLAGASEEGPCLLQLNYMDCRDFDGDGQTEVFLQYVDHSRGGYTTVALYERTEDGLARHTLYTRDLVDDFVQNTVVGYNADSRGLTVTYSFTRGDMNDPDNYYRHMVTGYCVLPEDFFQGREALQYAELHPYYNSSCVSSLMYYQVSFGLSDDAMLGQAQRTPDSDAHLIQEPVGSVSFDIGYDGQDFVITEPDEIIMDPFERFT